MADRLAKIIQPSLVTTKQDDPEIVSVEKGFGKAAAD